MEKEIKMKYIDLFAGVGGFRYGIDVAVASRNESGLPGEQKNISNNNVGEVGAQQLSCVYSNEFNKYANSVYRRHYGECDIRDIREVQARDIPDHDLLVGGFPCQSFSIAGKRGGFDDTRGTLFFEIARIVKQKQPRLLLLENVKGLLSHDKGNTFATIIATLDELGYDCQWQVLNSKDFGVPQNRERVFIIGHLRGIPRPQVFPILGKNPISCNEVGTITAIKGAEHSRRCYSKDGLHPALATCSGGNTEKKILMSRTVRAGGRRSPHGSKQNWDSYEVDNKIRRLTPVECERLQGFPDGWTETGMGKVGDRTVTGYHFEEQVVNDDGEKAMVKILEWGKSKDGLVTISDTQRYKMMGNAVTTNVITEIVKRLL